MLINRENSKRAFLKYPLDKILVQKSLQMIYFGAPLLVKFLGSDSKKKNTSLQN